MSLIAEDGTGLATAESYASVAEADTRATNFGETTWLALTTGNKEIALRKACDYMIGQLRLRWKGYRTFSAQATDWPRTNVEKADQLGGYGSFPNYYTITEIPVEIKAAQIDLAFKVGAGTVLSPDIDRVTKREKVGPLEVEYEAGSVTTYFATVEARLEPFLMGNSAMARLVRT